MRINTKPFGFFDLDERQIISFPGGIFGFEGHHQWALLDSSQPPFYWLQSLTDSDLAFVLMNPAYFRPEYQADVSEEDARVLQLGSRDDLLVFSIVTIPEDQANMTANLQGPILINKRQRIGRQGIQLDPRYKVRHRILDELAQGGQN